MNNQLSVKVLTGSLYGPTAVYSQAYSTHTHVLFKQGFPSFCSKIKVPVHTSTVCNKFLSKVKENLRAAISQQTAEV